MDGFGCMVKAQSPKQFTALFLSPSCNEHSQWAFRLGNTAERSSEVPCPHGDIDDKFQTRNVGRYEV